MLDLNRMSQLLAMGFLTLGVGLACGCGDSGAAADCQESTRRDCTCADSSPGEQTCTGGSWGACDCETCEPEAETCDGLDNDCDGIVDNNLDEVGERCQVAGEQGLCAAGEMACDGVSMVCEQITFPSDELCNLSDDDCDGEVDEGLGGDVCAVSGQLGLCGDGEQRCIDGSFACIQTVFPAAEICDLEDNNCDGTEDEGCACTPEGLTETCGVSTGECQEGTVTCTNGEWGQCDAVSPVPELCDGLDNNCDGVVDDGDPEAGSSCAVSGEQGPCASGVDTCQGGGLVCTQLVFAQTEICDNVDNDCDGTVDEGNPGGGSSCIVSGQSGECVSGTLQCQSGSLACVQTVFPVSEVCGDGLDNDCDGAVDEAAAGCQCTPPDTQSCGSDVGYCIAGTQTCLANGTWDPTCAGERLPRAETCNNIDDDCDGMLDNGVTRACYTGSAATRGVGECHDGVQTCTTGNWGSSCAGEQTPLTEVCDGKDNDCDGATDETGSWPSNTVYEVNGTYTSNAYQLPPYSVWTATKTISSVFSWAGDVDNFYWNMTNYNDGDNTIYWKCTVSGLAAGQTVNMRVGVHTGGYPGSGPWQFEGYDSTGGGNGRWLQVGFNSPQGPYGLLVGIDYDTGFGPCTNLSYTLTCALQHDPS